MATPIIRLGKGPTLTRTANILYQKGIETVEDLASRTEEEIRRYKGIGSSSITALREAMKEHGLCFRDEQPKPVPCTQCGNCVDGKPVCEYCLESEKKELVRLRDWFAGQALAGLNANDTWTRASTNDLVVMAYEQADAMLKAREGKGGERWTAS